MTGDQSPKKCSDDKASGINVTNSLDQLLCPLLATDSGNKTILCDLFKLPMCSWEFNKIAFQVPFIGVDNNTNHFREALYPVQTMENLDIVNPFRIRDRTINSDLIDWFSVQA